MNNDELRYLQALPRDIKLAKTKKRIMEAVYYFGEDGLYTSYSGGTDSQVLKHIVNSMYKDIPSVFCDTSLEYRSLRVHALEQVDIVIKPELNFKQTVTKYGYPVISKMQSMAIRKLTTQNLSEKYRHKLLYGDERGSFGKLSAKWHYLLDADFKISEECCDIMKKKPFKKYEKETGRVPILGIIATEGPNRRMRYINDGGCNAFKCKRPHSQPLGFWTKQDILCYLKENNIKIAPPYGEIVFRNGQYTTSCEKRTGCVFCMFGAHKKSERNRFQRLKTLDQEVWNYCIRGGKYDNGIWIPDKGLGMAHVLETLNIPYDDENILDGQISIFDMKL